LRAKFFEILSSVPKKTCNFFGFDKGACFWCLHLRLPIMSSIWSRILTGGASFFSRSAEENEDEEKKKKKTASFGNATHAVAILLSVTSSPS
jgi:hypothetical protein